MTPHKTPIRWAVEWNSCNRLNGKVQYFMWNGICPRLFKTRTEARQFVSTNYGYIRKRPDLRKEPHGWKVPRVVKVRVQLMEVS